MGRRHECSNNGQRIAAFLLCCVSGISAQSTLSLRIDSASLTINRSIYGALMENWGRDIYQVGLGPGIFVGTTSTIPNTSGMRNDIIAGLKDAGISVLEWPGGCYADQYHWKDGIAMPQSSRPGGEPTNGLGTPEYFQLLELTGAQGYLAFNVKSDSAPSMVAWLNYIDTMSTHPEWKNYLKYMKIGNEEWGSCGLGLSSQSLYQPIIIKYLAALPAIWKSRLTINIDGGSGGGWIGSDMQQDTGKVTGVALHYYAVSNWSTYDGPSIGFTTAQYYTKLNLAYSMESKVSSLDNTMNTYDPGDKVGLMVDEWGDWSATLGTGNGTSYNQSTCREALIAAMTLNIFNNHCKRVKMGLVAQPVNVIQALFLTKPSTTDSSLVKTPTFYVMRMMKVHQNAKMVPVKLTCPSQHSTPVISASASVDSTNKLNITLANIDSANSQTLAITLTNPPHPYQTITAQIVTGPTDSSYNDFGKPEAVNAQTFASSNYTLSGSTLNVTLPAHSVVQFALTPSATGILVSPFCQRNSAFSIKSAAGKVAIHYPTAIRTIVSLMLFEVDGRIIESGTLAMDAGHQSCVWQPKALGLGSRVYIVRVTVAGVSKSEPMILAR